MKTITALTAATLLTAPIHAGSLLDHLQGAWQVRSRIGPERWHFANEVYYSHGLNESSYRYLSSSQGDPGRSYAVETPDMADGAHVFVTVRNILFCEVFIVRNVHTKRLSGVLKMFEADCNTPVTTKVFRFHAKRRG